MFHCPFVNVHGLKFLHISVIGLWRSVSPPAFDRVNVTESVRCCLCPEWFCSTPKFAFCSRDSKDNKDILS